jgi:hypothetical protein
MYIVSTDEKTYYRFPWHRVKINFASRFTLLQIILNYKKMHKNGWKIFRITRTGKLKRFL